MNRWQIKQWQLGLQLMFRNTLAWLWQCKRHTATQMKNQWEVFCRLNNKRKLTVKPVQQKKAARASFFLAAKPVTPTLREAFSRKL